MERLFALLDKVVENRPENADSAIEELKKQVMALSEEPEPWVTRLVAKYFRGQEEQVMSEGRVWLAAGLSSAKQSMLFAIRDFERDRVQKGESLQIWLNKMKSQHKDLMTQL